MALFDQARWRTVTIALAALMLSIAAGTPHGDRHEDAPKKSLAAHEHHDGSAAPDHDACDLASACGAKILARGSGGLTIHENPWRAAMRIGEHPIPNGHISRPAQPPPRNRG